MLRSDKCWLLSRYILSQLSRAYLQYYTVSLPVFMVFHSELHVDHSDPALFAAQRFDIYFLPVSMEINSEKGWHFLKIFSLFKAGFRVFHFIIFVDLMCLVHSNPRGKLIVQFNNRFVFLFIPVDFLLFFYWLVYEHPELRWLNEKSFLIKKNRMKKVGRSSTRGFSDHRNTAAGAESFWWAPALALAPALVCSYYSIVQR